jgi:hypothetical protein
MRAKCLGFDAERCEICWGRRAQVFMVTRQYLRPEEVAAGKGLAGEERVVKSNVCLVCFEGVRATGVARVESVSLGEFGSGKERTGRSQGGGRTREGGRSWPGRGRQVLHSQVGG